MEYKPLSGAEQSRRDESRIQGNACGVCSPEDIEQLQSAVKAAGETGKALTVQGALTGISGGAVPQGNLVLETKKLNRICGLRRGNGGAYVLRVQSGVTLAQVQEFLRRPPACPGWDTADLETLQEMKKRPLQRFLPNPGEASASLGGLFATNAKGTNSLRCGSVGDHAEGLLWITAKGALWHLRRGKFVFDSKGCALPDGRFLSCATDQPKGGVEALHPTPGLDLIDFLAGSEGMLGIAGELELTLHPEPEECWAVIYFFNTEEAAVNFGTALRHWRKESPCGELLYTAEFLDSACMNLLRQGRESSSALRQMPSLPQSAKGMIYTVLEGKNQELMEAALTENLEQFSACGGHDEDNWAAMGRTEAERYAILRHSVPELVNSLVDAQRLTFPEFHKTAVDFSAPPALSESYYKLYRNGLNKFGARGYIFGHILENRYHVNLLAANPAEWECCRELILEWAVRVVEDGGLLTGENGVGMARKWLLECLMPSGRRGQIQGILDFMDPDRLFPDIFGRAK